MKITMQQVSAGIGPTGMVDGWNPGDVVNIDDSDKKAVAWARIRLDTGAATLVTDVAVKETRAPGRPPGSRA